MVSNRLTPNDWAVVKHCAVEYAEISGSKASRLSSQTKFRLRSFGVRYAVVVAYVLSGSFVNICDLGTLCCCRCICVRAYIRLANRILLT